MKKNRLKIAILTLSLAATTAFGYQQTADASTTYEIKQGDTLYSIAKEHHLTVSQLMQLNHLTSTTIYAGDKLLLPSTITIQKGDTLYSLANKYHTTVSHLKALNQLTSNTIYAGDKLIIPTTITVKKGDTLYRIAKDYGLSVQELKEMNGLTSDLIKVGQNLTVIDLEAGYDASKIQVEVTVKAGFTFDAEEPQRFILQYKNDPSYFSRIEILDSNADVTTVKKNSLDLLKGSNITEHAPASSGHPFYKDAEFFLHGSTSQTQTNIVVKKIDGKLVRFTIYYLNKEESEGITPHMIDILQTTKLK